MHGRKYGAKKRRVLSANGEQIAPDTTKLTYINGAIYQHHQTLKSLAINSPCKMTNSI